MNILPATITAITTSEHLSILTVSILNNTLHLLLAEASNADDLIGTNVTLAFKETEVILSKIFTPTTANIQSASILLIERGIILSQITLTYVDIKIIALVPTLTLNRLEIIEGENVYWIVQPSEISLLRGSHGI